MGGEATADRAGACQALTCTARFCILAPSHGMSPVSPGAVLAPKPPQETPNPPRADSRPLPPPTLIVSTPSAAPQPGGLPTSWRKSILRPGQGAESCLDPPRTFLVSLLLLLAAQRGAALATPWIQVS